MIDFRKISQKNVTGNLAERWPKSRGCRGRPGTIRANGTEAGRGCRAIRQCTVSEAALSANQGKDSAREMSWPVTFFGRPRSAITGMNLTEPMLALDLRRREPADGTHTDEATPVSVAAGTAPRDSRALRAGER